MTSQDGQIELKVAMPPQLGGDGNGTNPEQLFAAGYSSCFHNALVLVGRRAGYDLTGSTVAAKVGIGPNSSKRLRPRGRPQRLAAVAGPGHRGQAGGRGAPGVPVLERHARQHRCDDHPRLSG